MKEDRIIELRKRLHQSPEASMREIRTKEILMHFIYEYTTWDVFDRETWFYAYKKGMKDSSSIAFRADFDAVTCSDGKARHLCGHDGHSAILAGLAALTEKTYRDVYLIFQPGEEIGEGGKYCSRLIEEKHIEEIYAFHNIPGYEENTILIRDETFACASVGLNIIFRGKISHAAYPEQGINPGKAIADIIYFVDQYIKKEHKGIVLGTLIGIEAGGDSYGISAGNGQIRFTLRAEYQDEFEEMVNAVENQARSIATSYSMGCKITRLEEFPATINHLDCVEKLKKTVSELNLKMTFPESPFRWSEDFGYYLQKTKGAFFGIGCGEEHPGLHTIDYEFDDRIIMTAISVFQKLC